MWFGSGHFLSCTYYNLSFICGTSWDHTMQRLITYSRIVQIKLCQGSKARVQLARSGKHLSAVQESFHWFMGLSLDKHAVTNLLEILFSLPLTTGYTHDGRIARSKLAILSASQVPRKSLKFWITCAHTICTHPSLWENNSFDIFDLLNPGY